MIIAGNINMFLRLLLRSLITESHLKSTILYWSSSRYSKEVLKVLFYLDPKGIVTDEGDTEPIFTFDNRDYSQQTSIYRQDSCLGIKFLILNSKKTT